MAKMNKAAQALAKQRWKGKTKAQKQAHMVMMAQKRWATAREKESEKTS